MRALSGVRSVSASSGSTSATIQTTQGTLVLPLSSAGFGLDVLELPKDAAAGEAFLPSSGVEALTVLDDSAAGVTLCTVFSGGTAPKEVFSQKLHSAAVCSELFPLSLDRILDVNGDGSVNAASFTDLIGRAGQSKNGQCASNLSTQQLVIQPRTQNKLLVGGTLEGDVFFWDTQTAALAASLSQFDCAVVSFIVFASNDGVSKLQDSLACVAADGTVALIQLDSFKLRCVIPGRNAMLNMLATRGDEILLLYADNAARVWDLRSQELRHAVDYNRAIAVLEDGSGAWAQQSIEKSPVARIATGVLSHLAAAAHWTDAPIQANLRKAIEAAAKAVAPKGKSDELQDTGRSVRGIEMLQKSRCTLHSAGAQKSLSVLRPFLQCLWPTAGHLKRLQVFVQSLDLASCRAFALGTHDVNGLSVGVKNSASPSTVHTLHQLSLHAILRVLAQVDELSDDAHRAHTALLSPLIFAHENISLEILTKYFFDSNKEISESARILFDAALVRFSNDALAHLIEGRNFSRNEEIPPQKLIMLGSIASQRYKSLNPAMLKDISTSMVRYLNDEQSPSRQAIAVELCQRGLNIWQNYIDAMEVARTLFALATSQEGGVHPDIKSMARQATLQIADDNMPLFMTTLSHDILHARSPAHCSATMRLVAFMIRRKAMLLFPNLPRLAEAVVKSLDPTNTAMRETVVQAATVMISELVNSYPSIAFHGKLQRLAVGTHEGAVIMYDLKSATRLYVIEGHRRPLSACSFSPDGRRLVTVSLEEMKALIWKVGSSIASVFMPGSLPRQGGTDTSGAYKAFDFHLGGESFTTLREQLILKANRLSLSQNYLPKPTHCETSAATG